MASADITAKDTAVKGVNSPSNYTRSAAHLIDGGEFPGILDVDTHDICKLPAGAAVTGITVISLDSAASSGSATAQFKLKVGDSSAEALHTAIGKADLAAGDVAKYSVAKIKGYEADKEPLLQLTVGTAAFTALKLLVIVDYIPATEFITAG